MTINNNYQNAQRAYDYDIYTDQTQAQERCRKVNHPNIKNDKYSFELNRLDDLVVMIVTYANGAGDNRLYRRAMQNGYSREEIGHAILFCNSLLITEGNVDLACFRTKNYTKNYMPNAFSRAVSEIMEKHEFVKLKHNDERVVTETPYALNDLVRQAIQQRDTNVLLEQVMADSHMSRDLVKKIIDVCNYAMAYLDNHKCGLTRKNEEDLQPFIDSIASLSNRYHPEPFSISSINTLLNHVLTTMPTWTPRSGKSSWHGSYGRAIE
jgi:hypothetical protein